ncbi:MAG: histidine phosphotransferase family protein [Pseudomonadota bacterium]
MATPPAEIAALLGSRICHDLISPIGAISNGVELLSMSGAATLPEIDLIAQSVEHANARIGFFRVAFGAASPHQGLGEIELRQILDDLTRGSRLSIRWNPGGEAPRPEVKLAFLVINCLECAMPRGGAITVARDGSDWVVAGQAERLRIEQPMWDALRQPDLGGGVTAAEVQFILAPLVANDLGRTLRPEWTDTEVRVSF